MLGEHGAGPEVWLERGYQRDRGQNEGTEGPGGTATSRGVPQTLLDPSFVAKRVCIRVLGSGSKVFLGKTLYLHTISTANKTMFRSHIPAHSLPCSSPAYQTSSQGTSLQLNWDVLSPCVPWRWFPLRRCHRHRQRTFFSVFIESDSSLSSSFFNLFTLLLWQRTPWRILSESVSCP